MGNQERFLLINPKKVGFNIIKACKAFRNIQEDLSADILKNTFCQRHSNVSAVVIISDVLRERFAKILTAAAKYMRYSAGSKFFGSLVHKKILILLREVGYLF